ncbi:SDR family NAD(P)-dependent oxidoreductase [Nocardioides sp. ChNu-153]|uniref:SDR family NAD(P)-dependent oxidoreductase n=1 Tax=unclassified Nocardioides TaxID=2615069 RepID=UPI002404E0D5|nr:MULTISPECIES: SDR family NAD(P)-dependent oxidoreductase [unclassified Nocardioides]MDF9715066.1 SDR family NAD(P)-dependent oxidoreductase [Nocardioides sp. ChNu-99]MDN7122335.1 SDR family NAD(P)-dependent oxidoreductase [Nocardioides sp. ChNu-153]
MTSWTTGAARTLDTALDRAVVPGYTRLGVAVRRRLPTWPADPAPGALAGRTAAVTGASSGLGAATAEDLARLGAAVVLVVRDPAKGEAVRRELLARVPGAELTVQRCDVGDLADVRRAAGELRAALGERSLDVLVHNAGVMPPERTLSAQGHELSMAVHVLGPALLTELLRDRLAASRHGARVVWVTSGGMYAQALRLDDVAYDVGPSDYSPTTAYARSKRAQVELLPELARRWGPDGVVVAAAHPGWADTPGVADSLPGFHRLTGPVLRDAAEGADTVVWLAGVEPAPRSGALWHDRRPRPTALLRRTRTSSDERAALAAWVRDLAGLDA